MCFTQTPASLSPVFFFYGPADRQFPLKPSVPRGEELVYFRRMIMEKLLALAEDPRHAPKLIRHIEINERHTRILWHVLCIAYLTVSASMELQP